jgi:hypothetical protein
VQTPGLPYRPLRALLAALGIALLLSALLVGRPPSARLFWAELYNLGHIPLFGFMGLLAIEVSRSLAGRVLARPRAHYAVALAVVALLSLVTELLQTDMPGREASLGDGLNNLLGGACFLGVRAAFDHDFERVRDHRPRVGLAVVSILILVGAFWPLLSLSWSYGMRGAAFPVVVDFVSDWQRPFIQPGRSELVSEGAPDAWSERAGQVVAALYILREPWPGVTVVEPYPDWRGHDHLAFEIFSELETAIDVEIQIHDTLRKTAYRDRFNRTFRVVPGLNRLSVALDAVRRGPRGRDLDLSHVAKIILIGRRPDKPFKLYLSEMRLE